MVNEDIRHRVFDSEIRYKQIASSLGIRANYLSRIMRYPLSERNRKRIEEAIEELRNERGTKNDREK